MEPVTCSMSVSTPVPSSGKVAGVKVTCNGDRREGFFIPVEVDSLDPIFAGHGELTPVFAKIGLPILVRKCPSAASRTFERQDLDNQVVTYLMIDSASGFAAPKWQSYVGTVIVVRQDKKPLAVNHVEAMWMYIDRILDMFGDEGDAARAMMTRRRFDSFWKTYKDDEIHSTGRDEQERVTWESTSSPFDV